MRKIQVVIFFKFISFDSFKRDNFPKLGRYKIELLNGSILIRVRREDIFTFGEPQGPTTQEHASDVAVPAPRRRSSSAESRQATALEPQQSTATSDTPKALVSSLKVQSSKVKADEGVNAAQSDDEAAAATATLPPLSQWLESLRLDAYTPILRALKIVELDTLVAMSPERIDSITQVYPPRQNSLRLNFFY